MGVNKVEFNTETGVKTLIDLTSDSVSEDKVFKGSTFHDSDGEIKSGTFTIDAELSTQKSLIPQIKAALQGKAANSGGITPSGEIAISENGTHDVVNYAVAKVNVPIPDGYIKPSGKKEIAENGTHDVAAYATVNVNVPSKEPVIEPLNITENGTYTAPEGIDGYSPITVEVASSSGDTDLPEGYKRVDYILFDGNQIVDTGVIGNQDTQINVCFTREISAQRYLFGCAHSGNTAAITAYQGGTWRFGNKSATKPIGTVNNRIGHFAFVDKTTISVTGSVSAISDVNDFETIGTLLLGGCRSSDGSLPSTRFVGKILFFAIWQGDDPALKLIPVVSAEGQYRFWDMIGQKLHDSITDTPLAGGNF